MTDDEDLKVSIDWLNEEPLEKLGWVKSIGKENFTSYKKNVIFEIKI